MLRMQSKYALWILMHGIEFTAGDQANVLLLLEVLQILWIFNFQLFNLQRRRNKTFLIKIAVSVLFDGFSL